MKSGGSESYYDNAAEVNIWYRTNNLQLSCQQCTQLQSPGVIAVRFIY